MHVLREETRRFEMQHHALSEELVCHRGLEPRTSRSLPGRSRSATHTLAPCLGQDGPQLSLPQQKEMLLQKVTPSTLTLTLPFTVTAHRSPLTSHLSP